MSNFETEGDFNSKKKFEKNTYTKKWQLQYGTITDHVGILCFADMPNIIKLFQIVKL